MNKLRMLFSKTGRAIYISHLDVMRTMQRAFLRAGLPLKYSEGFNPHAQISVLLPLSVCVSSVCELMDFSLSEDIPLEELPPRLNAALPEGIEVAAVYEAESKVKNLKWLEIGGRFEYDTEVPEMSELESFFAQPEIVIKKRTKRGEGESDIKPGIRSLSFEKDDGAVLLRAVISAQEPTINPELLVSALRQKSPGLAPDFAEFERLEVYDAGMNIFR